VASFILGVVKKNYNTDSGHILRRNCLLKHIIEGKMEWEDEEEDVSRYWMTLRKWEGTGS
jgi:hypothetical protein